MTLYQRKKNHERHHRDNDLQGILRVVDLFGIPENRIKLTLGAIVRLAAMIQIILMWQEVAVTGGQPQPERKEHGEIGIDTLIES
jgi:hypothetical protein